jgi:hypothetical protein
MKTTQVATVCSHLLVPGIDGANPKTCQEWREVDCPEEIDRLLQERNQQHFGQSKDCNLTKEPFDFTMLFEGACHRAEALLEGTFTADESLFPQEVADPTSLLHLMKIFMDACKYVHPDIKNEISGDLSLEEYKGKIKAWDKRTSTSPGSNMHLGHLKVYWAHHLLDQASEQAEALKMARQSILHGHLVLLNYALQAGYSYGSWKTVVNTMLEKEPGNPKIHRLRVIHLYEADYNLILSVKWGKTLHYAVRHGYLSDRLYGSIPGREAIDTKFLRALEYEVTRLTRRNLVHFDSDATSCYNRIQVFIGNVISRQYGLHKNVVGVQGGTLAEAKYHQLPEDKVRDFRKFHITQQGTPISW